MEKQLQKKWVLTDTKALSEIIRGVSYGKQDAFQYSFENCCLILRGGNIQDGKIVEGKDNVFVDVNLIKREQFLKAGDVILVGSTGSEKLIGKAATNLIDKIDVSFGAFMMAIRPSTLMNKWFFSYYFQTDYYRDAIRNLAGGVNINNIRKEYIENLPFPLPPLPEQNRIVTKLDTLFAQLETIKTSMENIPILLKDFRQQVLTQAVTGKLTNCKVEEKRLDDLLTDVKYGTSKKSDYEIDGIPIFRIPNINDGEICDEDLKFSILDKKEETQLKLKEGDILIIRSNGSVSLVGQSAIIRKKHVGYSYAGYLIRLRCSEELLPEFLNYSLKSILLRSQIVDMSRSTTGVNNINSQEIKDLRVNWTSPIEQQEIVRRIENLFTKAGAIEKQYETLKAKIDTLPQAILYKAFKGELTEQLDSDGDARELLQQIQELKGVTTKVVKNTKLEKLKDFNKKVKNYPENEGVLRMVAESK